jgi:hypothetical protein
VTIRLSDIVQMDEAYCPPFAINARKITAILADSMVIAETLTMGFKPSSWKNLFAIFTFEAAPKDPQDNPNKEPKVESTFSLHAQDVSIYYQPSSINTLSESTNEMFIVPPRAIQTFSYLKFTFHDIGWLFVAQDAKLWLKEDFHYLKNSEIWLDLCHPRLSAHLEVFTYFIPVCIITIYRARAYFKWLK